MKSFTFEIGQTQAVKGSLKYKLVTIEAYTLMQAYDALMAYYPDAVIVKTIIAPLEHKSKGGK